MKFAKVRFESDDICAKALKGLASRMRITVLRDESFIGMTAHGKAKRIEISRFIVADPAKTSVTAGVPHLAPASWTAVGPFISPRSQSRG